MELNQYILQNLDFYHYYLDFIDNEKDDFQDYQNLFEFIDKLYEEREDFINFLTIVSKISENHHRYPLFIKKTKTIILHYQTKIKEIFSNSEIFDIFKNNTLILLFLIENEILLFDNYVYDETGPYESKYYDFLYPEMKEYYNAYPQKDIYTLSFFSDEITNLDDFNKKRHEGENDSFICKLIRSDLIDDFILYLNQNNYSPKGQIPYSKFETNSMLIENTDTTLIEYAAFFGSIQIFKYLLYSNNYLLNSRIWLYAIHGRNAKIIHILEDEEIMMSKNELVLEEAIKCHHNELAQYIENNYDCEENGTFLCRIFEYHNYDFIREEEINNNFKFLFYLIRFKYIKLVRLLLQSKNFKNSFLFDKNEYKKTKRMKSCFSEVFGNFIDVHKNNSKKKYVFNNHFTDDDYKKIGLIAEEFDIQMTHKYPTIIKLKGICLNSNHPIFLYKYYQNGSLNNYFKKKNKEIQTDTRGYIILLGIAIGMKYLESNHILHGEFYPENIYLDDNFYPIIAQYASHPYDNSDPMKPDIMIPKYVIKYSSPEDLLDAIHVNQSNVFTYSLIAYQIITKQIPFIDTSYFKHAMEISKGLRPNISMIKNKVITNFFEKCFALKPENRMSFDEIIDLITDVEFYSYFKCLDCSSVQKYLDIFGNEYLHLKNKF